MLRGMIVERTEHPGYLSNAYLVADRIGGHGILVDANDVIEPLLASAERDRLTITHVLVTHHHFDHVDGIDVYRQRLNVPVVASALTAEILGGGLVDTIIADGEEITSGELTIRALATPGHAPDHTAYLVNGSDCLTADCLFKGTVGGCAAPGGSYAELRASISRLLALPPDTVLHPGHREPTTVRAELESNPFVRLWGGLDPEGTEPCRVRGMAATLLLWAPDYDGGHKALLRLDDGSELVVGGSQVDRD
jgi:hydroxyacylglutathione hydrolase